MQTVSGMFRFGDEPLVDLGIGEERSSPGVSTAATGPGSSRQCSIAEAANEGLSAVLAGRTRWSDSRLSTLSREASPAEALLRAGDKLNSRLAEEVQGSFCFARVDTEAQEAILAVDRFGIEALYWTMEDDGTVRFSSSLDTLKRNLSLSPSIDQQSVFNFLYFHTVPSPRTIWTGISKLKPGERLTVRGRDVLREPYWMPSFQRSRNEDFADLRQQLFNSLEAAVSWSSEGSSPGAFLSGGLDSSTVCGVFRGQATGPVPAYSVGFSDEAYDELEYAKISARHFDLDHHCIVATTDDALENLEKIFAVYAEPFGNSSVVPTYLCARAAAEQGIDVLLAGDAGDELFAGNTRYAKQKLFQQYWRLPEVVRRRMLEPLLLNALGGVTFAPVRKLRRYVEQAVVPMPDRLESYNHLQRWSGDTIFCSDFLDGIDAAVPIGQLNERYTEPANADFIDRMLYLDWKFTLADNDLRKVVPMCDLAGVEARFPFLDERVVEMSMRVPSAMKLKRLRLRHFYKEALRGFLPDETLAKSKHGFGLPFGEWLKTSPLLQDFIYTALHDLGKRDVVRPDFIGSLIDEHRGGHAAYFGTAVWVFMSLEMWFRNHSDA